MIHPESTPLRTDFEAAIYLDATLAGLTPLLPIPLLDWWLEERFQRRMLERIAAHRGQTIAPAVQQVLHREGSGIGMIALRFLLKLPLRLVLKLMRKLVYILAIKESTEKLSYYWQRAFLIDQMLQAGHLDSVESARQAQRAMQATLDAVPSPLSALAGQVAQRIRRLRPWRRASAGELRDAAAEQRSFIERQWSTYAGFLIELAERYQHNYRRPVAA